MLNFKRQNLTLALPVQNRLRKVLDIGTTNLNCKARKNFPRNWSTQSNLKRVTSEFNVKRIMSLER